MKSDEAYRDGIWERTKERTAVPEQGGRWAAWPGELETYLREASGASLITVALEKARG